MLTVGKYYKTTVPFFLYDNRDPNSVDGERRIKPNSVFLLLKIINNEFKVLYEGRLGYLSTNFDMLELENYLELCK